MQTVLLIMKRKSNAQGIMLKLRDDAGLSFIYESDYTRAASAIQTHSANVSLIEVSESGECDIVYCLELSAQIRQNAAHCKLLLMCPEQDKSCVGRAVQAKREGQIDDFVFYDASIDYLASKLSSL